LAAVMAPALLTTVHFMSPLLPFKMLTKLAVQPEVVHGYEELAISLLLRMRIDYRYNY
jgi:hypothetical protein